MFSELGLVRSTARPEGYWALSRASAPGSALQLTRVDGVELCVDFVRGKARHRMKEAGFGASMLTKALGVRSFFRRNGEYPCIVDATGGLGQDAWALASTGCQLTLFEQHPVIHALLADALRRAAKNPATSEIASRVTLTRANAEQAMRNLRKQDMHAVYLDPMYPEKRRNAASKKGMQFLHELLGPVPAQESPSLFLSAVATGVSRVVVKRPKGAPCLPGSEQFSGQKTEVISPNTRYDIYLRGST